MLSRAARNICVAGAEASAAGVFAARRFRSDAAFAPTTGAMLPAGTFNDQTVLVTGGGTGLGRAMATRFSSLGAKVAIAGRRVDVLAKTAEEIGTETGHKVMPVQCDVSSAEAVASMLEELDGSIGLPSVVVNNAAGNFIAPSERLSANAFARVVSIVLNGTANVTLETARRLNKVNKSATFLAITTTYASTGSGFVVPSACAKAGVEAMIKSLAAEWGPKYGHRFVGIAPGPIETEGAFSRLDPTGQFKDMMIKRSPSQRLGSPEELANLATFLCSPFASWMSGEIVRLDGGETVALGGEFNALQQVSDKDWDAMEAIIRAGNKKSK